METIFERIEAKNNKDMAMAQVEGAYRGSGLKTEGRRLDSGIGPVFRMSMTEPKWASGSVGQRSKGKVGRTGAKRIEWVLIVEPIVEPNAGFEIFDGSRS